MALAGIGSVLIYGTFLHVDIYLFPMLCYYLMLLDGGGCSSLTADGPLPWASVHKEFAPMNNDEPSRWMTLEEVADYLKLNRSKLYDLAQRGEIPCSKVAGRWRFFRTEVDDWMLRQRPVRTNTERASDDDGW